MSSEFDTLVSSDGKVTYHGPFIPEGLEPERWYAVGELSRRGMMFLRDHQPSARRNRYRLTTYARAMAESGAWAQ